MARYDLIVRGGTIVTEQGMAAADVAVADGRFVEIAAEVRARRERRSTRRGWTCCRG
jgi:N-acyl-D-aspartate/D-glutamate deacylase